MLDQGVVPKNLKLKKTELIAMGTCSCDPGFHTVKVSGGAVNLTLGWPLKVWKSVGPQ